MLLAVDEFFDSVRIVERLLNCLIKAIRQVEIVKV